MPTRNINLTPQMDSYVTDKIREGPYANASEVLRAGLRALERREQEYEAKLAALRAAIDEGDACDPATDMGSDALEAHMDAYIEGLVAKEEDDRCQRNIA